MIEVCEELKTKAVSVISEKGCEIKSKVSSAVVQLIDNFEIYFDNLKFFLLDWIKNKFNKLVKNFLFFSASSNYLDIFQLVLTFVCHSGFVNNTFC